MTKTHTRAILPDGAVGTCRRTSTAAGEEEASAGAESRRFRSAQGASVAERNVSGVVRRKRSPHAFADVREERNRCCRGGPTDALTSRSCRSQAGGDRYRRSIETSSVRWRCERPPMVLLGEIRHWTRTLLTFTRPYFGTARSMSKTFAVSTNSGGSRSRSWMLERPALRSRFSCARRVRIWFARSSASILWTSERSGAATEGLDGVFVAGGTAASLHLKAERASRTRAIWLDLYCSLRYMEAS